VSRTPAQVVASAQRRVGTYGWKGLCLKASRMAAGAPGGVYDATTAWKRAKYRHSKGTPPKGSFVFWTGGSQGHGHVVVSDGGGYCYSNDIFVYGRYDRCSIRYINEKWGNLRYVGWTEDVNGVLIDFGDESPGASGGKVPAKPKPRGKLTINGEQYPDIAGISAYWVNKARASGKLSRHVWYVQKWLNKVMGGTDVKPDGRWDRGTQALFDRFRREKLHQHGADATGRVGVWSLGKLNDMARSAKPVRAGK